MMGNSMPTEESGAPRVPEQSGTPMVPEESGAPSVPEQSGMAMVPEESGTTSVPEGAGVSTVQDVGTASVPEGAGVAVGQERSESEADSVLGHSPSYADHVQGGSRYSVRACISASRYSVRTCISACGCGGEAEERLLRQLFMKEQERPSNVEDMYDSLSQALTIRDRSFLTRVSLGQGASSRYLPGGSSSVYGLNRLERPEEMLAPTPFQPKLPMYPEPEQRPKLMVDASTTTDNAADQWSEWLRSARQGRSLREWGILAEDLVMAIKYLSEAHPVVTNGRWSNAGRRKAQPPNVLGMLGYLKEALRCVDNFDKAPSGYRGLIFGPTALVFERPASSTQADEAESWKYITASMAVRVQRLVDAKRRKAQAVSEHTAVFLQTAKSAPRPRPRLSPERGAERVVQSPTTPAESGASSGSDSSEVSGVSGESQLEGEGVAEAIGVIRSCQDKGESLWTPGVVCRLFETPELPPNVFPEVTKAMEEQAGSAGHVAAPDAAAASTDVAAGAAVVPPTPRTEAKSLSSLPSVIFRPGRLIQKTLMIEAADGSSVPAPPAIPTRHPLPQPPPAPLNQGSPNLGQTRAEREFVLPKPTSVAQSSSEAQFEDYESVVEAARAAVESASQQL
ncbi:unnamed protein product [Symbiodinium sp. KB8]|nr:unnamed protein product [Symbiodinium sp. KB8]